MPLYVAIDPPEQAVENKVPPGERIKLRDGVWLVWSPFQTPRELDDDLGLKVDATSIVFSVSNLSGYADSNVADKINELQRKDDS